MRQRGSVNLMGVGLIAAIVGGIYWFVMISPPYLDNLDIKEAVNGAFNDSGRMSDEALRHRLTEAASRVGHHTAVDEVGNTTEVPGLGLTPEQITVFRDEVRKTILLKVEYDQQVEFKPFKRFKEIHFVTAKEGPVPTR